MTKQGKPPLTRRLIFSIQPGGVGKSTVFGSLISYLNFAEVPFAASDSDAQHKTLFNRNPGLVTFFDSTTDLDAFHILIQGLPDEPVILVDFPAQKADFLIEASQHFKVLDGFEQEGVRPTILVFADNDTKSAKVAADTVRYFQDGADYILVENPAKFRSDTFQTTGLYKSLVAKGTPTVRLPVIDSTTRNSWSALERTSKQYVSLDEACTTRELYWTTRNALNGFRNSLLVQFEDIAVPRIVPDSDLIQNRVTRAEAMAAVPVNALDDPML